MYVLSVIILVILVNIGEIWYVRGFWLIDTNILIIVAQGEINQISARIRSSLCANTDTLYLKNHKSYKKMFY